MNITRILSHLGLQENIDYTLDGETIVMLPQGEETPAAPSEQELERAQLELRVADLGDVMELVGEYLKDHVANEDESINPEAFSIANINDPASSFWRMSIAKPTLEQLEALRADLDPRKVLMAESAAALKFLAETDYLIIREMDSGVPCPAEIKAARQAAREKVIK
jgi:hypothetical protein